MYLECIGTSGSFEVGAQTLEFHSSVKWRPSPLEVIQEPRDSVPEEAGKRTLLSDEEGKSGLFLSCGRFLGVPLEWRRVCQGTS